LLPQLFVVGVDGTLRRQLTTRRAYADSHATWIPGDSSSITYLRRPVLTISGNPRLGPTQPWNVQIDGSSNARRS
jgi:hypothetical protein